MPANGRQNLIWRLKVNATIKAENVREWGVEEDIWA